MKLADAIRQAVETANSIEQAQRIREIADFMRFRLGLNYEKSFKMVRKVFPDMTLGEWDALLLQADNLV